jgi:prepilin-type N-terminal cleavage/methylation domain-containing protein
LRIADRGLNAGGRCANPKSTIRNPQSRGFTLPEVLAALVFVGIVLPVVMRGLTVSMQASSAARHRVEAAQLAKQKLDEFLIVRDPSSFISATGDFGTGWNEYTWTSRAQLGEDGVYDVTVTVAWLEQSQQKSFALSTMIYPSTTTTTEESTTTGGTP